MAPAAGGCPVHRSSVPERAAWPKGRSGLKALLQVKNGVRVAERLRPRSCESPRGAARTAGWPLPGMYGDRDVAVQAPQDVLERSPGTGVRLAGRSEPRRSARLSGLKALPQRPSRSGLKALLQNAPRTLPRRSPDGRMAVTGDVRRQGCRHPSATGCARAFPGHGCPVGRAVRTATFCALVGPEGPPTERTPKLAVAQPGRPDGRYRGCTATGMSPSKRHRMCSSVPRGRVSGWPGGQNRDVQRACRA